MPQLSRYAMLGVLEGCLAFVRKFPDTPQNRTGLFGFFLHFSNTTRDEFVNLTGGEVV